MSSSYSSDDSPPPNPTHHVKKSNRPLKPTRHTHARKPSTKQHLVGPVRILKRGEEDDDYTDTGDSKDELGTKSRKKGHRQPADGKIKKKKNNNNKVVLPTTATTTTTTTRASAEHASDAKKKKNKKKPESTRPHLDRTSIIAPKEAELPKALSIAFLNPPSRSSTPVQQQQQQVKVYGLEQSSPVSIQRPRVSSANSSPRKASPNGGEYAGPTFSNSPAPSALPKPAFTTPQKMSPPPTYSLDYRPATSTAISITSTSTSTSKKNGLADAAFWMEGGIMSGNNTTANVTPSESPGSRSGGVTPTMFTTMGTLIAPIPTHRHQPYSDELQVGNPSAQPKRNNWKEQHDDGGSGSMLLELLRGNAREEAQQNDLDVWSQGLKSLLKMS